MKIQRTISILFVLLLIFISGCMSEDNKLNEDTPSKFNSDSIYQYNISDGGNMIFYQDCLYYYDNLTLMRYNINTQNISFVCEDPLCDHKTIECPFYGAERDFHIYKNKIYFLRLIFDGKEAVLNYVCYNMNDSKLSIVDTYPETDSGWDISCYELFTDNYRYYYKQVFNESSKKWEMKICRMDLSEKYSTIYSDEDNVGVFATRLIFNINDRVYFTDGKAIWSTALDFTDKKFLFEGKFNGLIKTDGNYIYYSVKINKAFNYIGTNTVYTIHRINLDGTNDIDLHVETTDNWVLTDNSVFYQKYDEKIIGTSKISGYAYDKVILTCSEFHCINNSTLSDKLLYTFSNNEENTRLTSFIVINNCAYGTYTIIKDKDSDGNITQDEIFSSSSYEVVAGISKNKYSLIKINLESGAVDYINN
jgi:hypothetical protein